MCSCYTPTTGKANLCEFSSKGGVTIFMVYLVAIQYPAHIAYQYRHTKPTADVARIVIKQSMFQPIAELLIASVETSKTWDTAYIRLRMWEKENMQIKYILIVARTASPILTSTVYANFHHPDCAYIVTAGEAAEHAMRINPNTSKLCPVQLLQW